MIYVNTLSSTVYVTTDENEEVVATSLNPSPSHLQIIFEDEGSALGTAGTVTEVNFAGAGVTASRSADRVTVTIPGSGGSGGHVIENAGTPLTARANLNFSNGLTASDNTPDTDVKLGGLLTNQTLIDTDGTHDIDIGDISLGLYFEATTGFLHLNGPFSLFSMGDADDGGGGLLFTDSRTIKQGIKYAAAGYVTDARSLIDKGYGDATYAPISGGAYWSAASGVTLTGNNTITMGANTVTFSGNRVTFGPTATVSGINVGEVSVAPSSLVNGDVFYNSSAHQYSIHRNGSTYNIVSSLSGVTSTRLLFASGTFEATGSSDLTFTTASKLLALTGRQTIAQQALAASWTPALTVTPGAHTSMTASTEFVSNDFQGASQQWTLHATPIAVQRFNYFRAFTMTGTGATATATDAYGVFMEAPIAGSNAAITRKHALGLNDALQIAIGTTVPSVLANTISLSAKDSSDGSANSTLALYLEQAPEATATFTQSHRLKIWVNGTEYYLPLDNV